VRWCIGGIRMADPASSAEARIAYDTAMDAWHESHPALMVKAARISE